MGNSKDIEVKLGFEEVRSKLKSYCSTLIGRKLASGNLFSNDVDDIKYALDLVAEMKYLIDFQGGIPNVFVDDFSEELERIKIPGTYIEIEQILLISTIIDLIGELKSIFAKNSIETPLLNAIGEKQSFEKNLLLKIRSVIGDDGEVKSSASEKLATIRDLLEKQRRKLGKSADFIIKSLKEKGIVAEEHNLSIRSGRLVIPVNASKKRLVQGVIIDESSTGQTVFIEPIETFELNNEIQNLEFEERREIVKILTDLTDDIRPLREILLENNDFVGYIDFVCAKAKLAVMQKAVFPRISDECTLSLINARHPVLEESLAKQQKQIVPLNIEINKSHRIIIISGPNAGGKSVAMKTCGLVQYIFQCGLFVPADDGSLLFPFDSILCDIGDQQSIENDLSTYSSHLLNMKMFLDKGTENSLVLIDEFGSGTEPESGGAIAEAVLHSLNEKKVFGIITTHYFNLKIFASKNEGVLNAAMLFDSQNMCPLYQLRVGKPGSSFAIEIATSIGLPKNIINSASEKIGNERLEMEKMMQDLETEKLKLDKRRRELEVGEDFVKELVEKYEHLNRSLVEKRNRIIKSAELDSEKKLKEANALIEKTIKEIKESKADKAKIRTIRDNFETQKKIIVGDEEKKKIEQLPLSTYVEKKEKRVEIRVGDTVKLSGGNEKGEVVELKGSKAKIIFDNVSLLIPIENLEKTNLPKNIVKKKFVSIEMNEFSLQLDLRGKRYDEAVSELEKYIDKAMLSGIREFSILHGKGNGILRTAVRQYLKMYRDILEYKNASLENGGEGITEVRIF